MARPIGFVLGLRSRKCESGEAVNPLHWFRRAPLKPGKCECGHKRCQHRKGKKECVVAGSREGYKCACAIFILAEIDVVSELERISRL